MAVDTPQQVGSPEAAPKKKRSTSWWMIRGIILGTIALVAIGVFANIAQHSSNQPVASLAIPPGAINSLPGSQSPVSVQPAPADSSPVNTSPCPQAMPATQPGAELDQAAARPVLMAWLRDWTYGVAHHNDACLAYIVDSKIFSPNTNQGLSLQQDPTTIPYGQPDGAITMDCWYGSGGSVYWIDYAVGGKAYSVSFEIFGAPAGYWKSYFPDFAQPGFARQNLAKQGLSCNM